MTLSNILQAWLPGVLAVCGVVYAAGSNKSDLQDHTKQIAAIQAQQAQDHDKLTTDSQKLTDIGNDVTEIKGDVKHLLEHQNKPSH